MRKVVAKFGGSSLASASQVRKVLDIVRADPSRKWVVASAPGRRHSGDQKVTDLLYEWHRLVHMNMEESARDIKHVVFGRFASMVVELGLDFDISSALEKIGAMIDEGASADFAASRGEYLMAQITAAALGGDWKFIDAADCIKFDVNGQYNEFLSHDLILTKTAKGHAVIPGFYGAHLATGEIKTFSRGGSDLTGAIVARAVNADLYENWTDVSGIAAADPRVIRNPRYIKKATFRELRELAYSGMIVFHEDAMFPVQSARIKTKILNTNRPEDEGTEIVPDDQRLDEGNGAVIGIASRKGFVVVSMDKAMMNREVGFARRVLESFEENGVSIEHMPSGIDSISVVVDGRFLDGKIEKILKEIELRCQPESIRVEENIALIATVGRGMVRTTGIAARLFAAVANAGVNIRMINQGASELNIIAGVANADCEAAVRAIYREFIDPAKQALHLPKLALRGSGSLVQHGSQVGGLGRR